MDLTDRIKLKALELGFSDVGIAPCEDYPEYAEAVRDRPGYEWAIAGEENLADGCLPSTYFPEGKSIIVTVHGFGDIDFPEELADRVGKAYLARCYVPRLEDSPAKFREDAFIEFLESEGMKVFHAGSAEHTFLLPARYVAAKAGVTTYGNNTFARTEKDGSYIIICTFIVDQELRYDEPTLESPCPDGCTLCMDACPTGAIEELGRINPMKCVLLLNTTGGVNTELREATGERIHGCNVCQDVCPRNHDVLKNARRKDPFLEELVHEFSLEGILFMDEQYYEAVVQPIMYNYITDLDIFRRNAAIAMGNSGDASYVPALERAIDEFAGTPVEECAQWALDRLRAQLAQDMI